MCCAQYSIVFVPATPYDGCLPQPSFIMTRLICTGKLTRSRSLMSPCCKAVKGVSRKHTVNLFFYCLLTEAEQTLSKAGIPFPKILKRELYGNFLAFAKGYQFSSKMCQRLRDCHPIIITLAHPEGRRRSSYLRAQRISRRGEDVILTQCSARYEKSETETPTPLIYVRQGCRSTYWR